jgi:hypothetical protein
MYGDRSQGFPELSNSAAPYTPSRKGSLLILPKLTYNKISIGPVSKEFTVLSSVPFSSALATKMLCRLIQRRMRPERMRGSRKRIEIITNVLLPQRELSQAVNEHQYLLLSASAGP